MVDIRVVNHLDLILWCHTIGWLPEWSWCILTSKWTHQSLWTFLKLRRIAILCTQREWLNILSLINLLISISSVSCAHAIELSIFGASWRTNSSSWLQIFIVIHLLSMVADLTLLIHLWKILLWLIIHYLRCFSSLMFWLVTLLWR